MTSEENVFAGLHDEFVLIGPVGVKDRILARSSAAGMDLIGYAMDRDESEYERRSSWPLTILLEPSRTLHRVTSWPVHNLELEADDRRSSFRFAWVGKCTRRDIESIGKSFNANIRDIANSYSDGDKQQLELSLAPVLLRCSMAHQRANRSRRVIYIFLIIYMLMVVLGASISLLPRILPQY
jgi:hypothetical protein